MGIERTYMSRFFFDLNNEMLIHLEQITRLIRDTMHFTSITRQTTYNTYYRAPEYHLNGTMFTTQMEEACK